MKAKLQLVGENIRRLRVGKRLSQQRLAELAGISYKYLGEVERNQSSLSVEVLFQIASGLGIEAYTLLQTDINDAYSQVLRNIGVELRLLDKGDLDIVSKILKIFIDKRTEDAKE